MEKYCGNLHIHIHIHIHYIGAEAKEAYFSVEHFWGQFSGETSDGGGRWKTGGSISGRGNTHRASLPCGFSHEREGWFCGWRPFHTCCTRRASLLCGSSDAHGGLMPGRSLCHTRHKYMPSHYCVFSGELWTERNAWRSWDISHICILLGLYGIFPGVPHMQKAPQSSDG